MTLIDTSAKLAAAEAVIEQLRESLETGHGGTMNEVERQLERARNRPGFMERLQRRIEEDKPILDKLKVLEREQQNQMVDVVMAEIRRLANHECRYPKPNNQGFPVDQCLDCGAWLQSPAAPEGE